MMNFKAILQSCFNATCCSVFGWIRIHHVILQLRMTSEKPSPWNHLSVINGITNHSKNRMIEFYVEIGLNHWSKNDWIIGRDSWNSNLIKSAILLSLNMNYALHQLHNFGGQKHAIPFATYWLSFHWKLLQKLSSRTRLQNEKNKIFFHRKFTFNIYVFNSLKLRLDLFMSATNGEKLSTVWAWVWCEVFFSSRNPKSENVFKRKLLQTIWFLVLFEKGCTCQKNSFSNKNEINSNHWTDWHTENGHQNECMFAQTSSSCFSIFCAWVQLLLHLNVS